MRGEETDRNTFRDPVALCSQSPVSRLVFAVGIRNDRDIPRLSVMSTFRGRPIVPAPFSLGNEVMEARLRLPPRPTATRLRFNLSLLVLPSSFSFSPSLSFSLPTFKPSFRSPSSFLSSRLAIALPFQEQS